VRQSEHMVTIIFQPEGRRVQVPAGTTVLDAARQAGLSMVAPCGGNGECGKCRVEILQGNVPAQPPDRSWFSEKQLQRGFRLACLVKATHDLTVRIPFETRVFSQKILTRGTGEPVPLEPAVSKFFLQLTPPDVDDQRGDFERILEGITKTEEKKWVDFEFLPHLSRRLRKHNYKGTAVFVGNRLIDFEAGNSTERNFGVALDVGTTTLVGILLDLNKGEPVAVDSEVNPQMTFGDDLISRIDYAATHQLGTAELQRRLVRSLNTLIARLAEKASVAIEEIYEMVAVGNTVMQHLLLKLNPEFLGQAPFAPTLQTGITLPARLLGLKIHPRGDLHVFPNIAGFVGGDAVAVILATGISERPGNVLAVDIGTNGEILLSVSGRLLAASAAAGPAFEGARIFQGMRGTTGAIERVKISDGRVQLEVIDGVAPLGICGSGLIDAVAELRKAGLIDVSGRLNADCETCPEWLRRRVVDHPHGKAFVLAEAEESGIEGPVLLTQKDIRELQLAKGAIATAIKILLKEGGIRLENLDEILLAGAFGNYIDRENAMWVGLIPDLDPEKVRFVGNAASAGAQMAAVSLWARQKAEAIARKARHLELSIRPDFQEEFMEAMFFPENVRAFQKDAPPQETNKKMKQAL